MGDLGALGGRWVRVLQGPASFKAGPSALAEWVLVLIRLMFTRDFGR